MNQTISYNTDTKVKDFGFSSPKFIRRGDLSILDRINIAHTALMAQKNNDWGVISELSNFYMIFRSFVYMLAHNLLDTSSIIFGPTNSNQITIDKKLSFDHMLSLRMEGRCSIEATSTIMKRFGINLPSTGSISQYLKQFGSFVPNTLATGNDEFQMVVFLSDEIFLYFVCLYLSKSHHREQS